MKAYVYVSLKKSVLDPQGKTIHGALKKMGYKGIDDLRQGKYFEIALDNSVSKEDAQAEVERIAREVLTNPVIEEFSFKLHPWLTQRRLSRPRSQSTASGTPLVSSNQLTLTIHILSTSGRSARAEGSKGAVICAALLAM